MEATKTHPWSHYTRSIEPMKGSIDPDENSPIITVNYPEAEGKHIIQEMDSIVLALNNNRDRNVIPVHLKNVTGLKLGAAYFIPEEETAIEIQGISRSSEVYLGSWKLVLICYHEKDGYIKKDSHLLTIFHKKDSIVYWNHAIEFRRVTVVHRDSAEIVDQWDITPLSGRKGGPVNYHIDRYQPDPDKF